jgi:uncharacterized protein YecT (DUF1311 family)
VAAWRNEQNPLIQQEITKATTRLLLIDGFAVATNFLIDTVRNKEAPWSARTECAKTIVSKADKFLNKTTDQEGRALAEYSTSELEAFIKGGQRALAEERNKTAIEAEVVLVTTPTNETPTDN